MTLILNNDDIQKALNVKECLDVMEESYREQAASRAVNRPTSQTYLPHPLPQSSYNFKSVDGGVGKVWRIRALYHFHYRPRTTCEQLDSP